MADNTVMVAEPLKLSENSSAPGEALSIPSRPHPPGSPPLPLLNRRRDRDSRERRDDRERDRDTERPSRYFDRNISPPQRDRERDYKRRRSPSPPPYRDRHYSPSRRSPPPIKRSRREDGGLDRRGSPRGADDRRFGYDYGGYDRGVGARYWSNSRSGNRQLDSSQPYPEYEFGHAGRGDSSDTGRAQREGLMTYKQFIQELEDDILPAEAERRYGEYRSGYIFTQKRNFFESHKGEEWLKDKYHPTNLVAVIERRNENAQKIAKDFMLDLQSGTLDLSPFINASLGNKLGHASNPNSEDEADGGGRRRRQARGLTKGNDCSAAPKTHPVSSEPRRILIDVEQALSLARKLDTEKGIKDNILYSADNKVDGNKSGGSMGPVVIIRGLASVKGLEGIELLDTLLTYLWRVHGLDYYGMTESSEAKGLRHVRTEGKTNDETSNTSSEWEEKLNKCWQERLQSQDPLEKMSAKEKIDMTFVEGLDPYVRKIRDEKYGWKYGCGAKGCTKLFHAAEFVHKHLKLKHPDLVLALTSKIREDLYFQNYMNDLDAPGGKPVMQQPLPKEKIQRHRSGLAGRLRDDRGSRREYDRLDRNSDGERFDRPDGSPSRDRISKDEGDVDESLDTFSRFSSDMPPPPVLMPVPGAGPLGPFVPAPPEVAMRMLRDQGGSSAQESNGRTTRSTPMVNGPSPILAVPPALRQDPRRIRSYHDLDAPEDEVTVMDYRSL